MHTCSSLISFPKSGSLRVQNLINLLTLEDVSLPKNLVILEEFMQSPSLDATPAIHAYTGPETATILSKIFPFLKDDSTIDVLQPLSLSQLSGTF